jgi:hypothetical protein
MIGWRALAGENSELYSSIGLRPIDDITGRGPIGWVKSFLDLADQAGVWKETGIKAVFTTSGMITYPALGRTANPVGQPQRQFRVRIETEFYVPLYRKDEDGIVLDVYPYNDTNPPLVIPSNAQNLSLVPSITYPFSSHIRVLRGVVVDQLDTPMRDAEVRLGNAERVVTDEKGAFGLPLRWVGPNDTITVDAVHPRSGQSGDITVTLPQALGGSQKITIF